MQSSLVDTLDNNDKGSFVEAMYLSHIEPEQVVKLSKQQYQTMPNMAKLEDRDPYDYVGPNGYPAYYCVGSVEIVDHDKEIVDIDGIKEVLHIMKEQGALIQGFHSNQPVGKWFDYGFFNASNGKRAMYLGYELYDHYESNRDMIRRHHLSDDDPDKIRGLSIGGKVLEKNRECDEHTCYTRLKKIEGWEFSCVDHPANPGATHIEDPTMLEQIAKSMVKRDKRRKQSMANKPKLIRKSPSSSKSKSKSKSKSTSESNTNCKPCEMSSHPSFVKGDDGMYKCPECGAAMKMYEKGNKGKTNKEDISDDENQDGDAMDAYDSYNESSGSSYQDEEEVPQKMDEEEEEEEEMKGEDYDDEQGEVPGEQDTGPDEYSEEDSDKMSEMEGDQMATENNNGEGNAPVTREEFVPLKEMVMQMHSAMGLTKQQKVPKVIEKDGIKYQMIEEEDSEGDNVNKSQQDNSNDETAQLKAELEALNKKFANATLRKSGMPDQLNKQDSNIKGQTQSNNQANDLIKMANGRVVSQNSFVKNFEPLGNEAKFHAFMEMDRPRRAKTPRMGGIATLG